MKLETWLSIGSLSVAIFSIIYTYVSEKKLRKQQIEINNQILSQNQEGEINKKKALICADTYKSGQGWRMKIYNKGEATARNIRFYSEDIEKDKSRIIVRLKLNPYPRLNKHDHFDVVLHLCSGHNPAPIVKFIWDDEFGNDQEREQTLNLTF